MSLRFTKMHGLGNDYVLVSLFDQTLENPAQLAPLISDRHRGVGSDGLILVAPPHDPHAHVRMIIFNPDGSTAEMCGNGIRCVAKLAYERNLARANPLIVESPRGLHPIELTLDDHDRVQAACVDMGEPVLDAHRIPVTLGCDRVIAKPVLLAGTTLHMTCVSMGNPHAIFFERDIARVPLAAWGPAIENRPMFRDRVNVHFAQVIDQRRVRMISWERGAGITLACGTGAAAVCVAAVLTAQTGREMTIELPGGELQLRWDADSNHVFMTGPAEEVFTGQWSL